MRNYGKVAPQFWMGETGKRIKAAGPEAVIVALYLVTCPHANMIGLYYLPKLYLAHETGLGMEGACKGLQTCIDGGFCEYEESSEHVLVLSMARFQIADTLKPEDKRCKGIQSELSKLPQTHLAARFREMYGSAFHLQKVPGQASPSEAPSNPLRSQEQEQEQKQEQKRGKRASPRGSRLPDPFVLPIEWRIWAEQARPHLNIEEEAAKFADYWHGVAGAKALKADWLATWRNWIRNAHAPRGMSAVNGGVAHQRVDL